MAAVPVDDLRNNLAYVLTFVRQKRGRIIITRRGRAIAEIVPVEDAREDEKGKFELQDHPGR